MANISDLKFDHKNARKRTDSSARLIQESLQRYGAARSIVIDEDNRILAGNGTIEGAKALGLTKLKVVEAAGDEIIAVRRSGLSEDDKVGLALADNRAAELSDWDAAMLQQLSEEHDIAPWFEQEDLDALLQEAEQLEPVEGNTDPDEVPEAPDDPITKPGDLWILGNHRLLCGDSTNIQHVERLMDGQKADMVFTDPPYGLSYQSNMRTKTAKFAMLENDDKIITDWLPLATAFSSGFCFVWTTWKVLDQWLAVTKDFAPLTNMVVWDKGGGGIGDLKKTYSTDHEIALVFNRGAELTGKRIGSVWDIGKDRATDYVHPTQKPVALAELALDTTTERGNVILDFFGGSGSTLIACERQHRYARLMELDPAYCDVIVKRWEDFTGNTAICQPSDAHFTPEPQEAF
jgi:DNA modification methylase